MKKSDVLVIGSGMGALTSAVLLANKGLKVRIIEQNWQAGGCTSSYWRKGYVFEAGATTLVGLGKGMPLQYLIDKVGVELPVRKLELPMQVHLKSGEKVNRFEDLDQWITEAEMVFGSQGQWAFWKECYSISQFVWKNSLAQLSFPPRKSKDFLQSIKSVSFDQLVNFKHAFISIESLLKKHGLHDNERFKDFVNEQLLITAQNHISEVNTLFGAAALCYTNYPNYYIDGGLLNLVNPLTDYVREHGGELLFREVVKSVEQVDGHYLTTTTKGEYLSDFVVSGIPINNTLDVFNSSKTKGLKSHLLKSADLNSAFQMGIGFIPHRQLDSIHHQIHLNESLAETGSASIFISLNHPDDVTRTDEAGHSVMSVSTHIPDPANRIVDSSTIEEVIVNELVKREFLKRENVRLIHSATPKAWSKWTGRKWGFVGGYPQFMKIKPWQMLDSRLDGHKAYQVGDTVYPGQGIPGVTLSGIIAVEKMKLDWRI